MTNPKLLIPLRVPELGPYLGKLITGSGRELMGISLAPFRYQLATKVIELAGEARRLAAHGERTAALATLGREAWLAAWNETVTAIAGLLVQRIDAHLAAEARAVRMSARRRARLTLDAAERRALAARLGSVGADLVPVLDRIDLHGGALATATGLERQALDDWQSAVTLAARRLESAWLALESTVSDEIDRWRGVFDQVAAWRKPLWPVVLVGVLGLGAAIWIGLVLGGFVPEPAWTTVVWQWVRP